MTKTKAIAIAREIKRVTKLDIFISKSVGGWVLVLADGPTARIPLSPSMPINDLYKWLKAFAEGVALGASSLRKTPIRLSENS